MKYLILYILEVFAILILGGYYIFIYKDTVLISRISKDPNAVLRFPLSQIKASRSVLNGEPNSWSARIDDSSVPSGKNVAWISDRERHTAVFYVNKSDWTMLSTFKGLPLISDILDIHKSILEQTLNSDAKGAGVFSPFGNFMRNLSCLWRGYSGYVLTKGQLELDQKNAFGLPVPLDLYGDVIKITDSTFEIQVNLLTIRGSIDHWIVTGIIQENGILLIKQIIVKQLKPDGSYAYPIMGDSVT